MNVDEVGDVLGTSVIGAVPLTEPLMQDASFSLVPFIARFILIQMLEIFAHRKRIIFVG